MATETDTELEVEKKGSLVKNLIVVALLGAAGFFAYITFFAPEPVEEDAAAVEIETEDGAVVEVSLGTVNLGNDAGSFIRLSIGLVMAEGADPVAVEAKFPLVKDAMIEITGNLSATEVLQGGGRQQLREALTTRVNEIYADGEVKRVVLTELLAQ